MKKARKIVKLALPGWFMHWWLPKRYGIAAKVPTSSVFAKVLILLSPYVVSAILQQRVDTDRRVLKYFLPYGKMCARMMLVYGRNVGNAQRDKGFLGRVRSVLPYGLILWWDREDRRIEGEIVKRQAESAAKKVRQTAPASTMDRTIVSEIKQFIVQQMDVARDRMEVLSMRSLIGSATPSVSVVVTGSATHDEVSGLVDALCKSTIGEVEIIIAAYMVGDSAVPELKTRRGVHAVWIPASGSSLRDARNLAMGKAKGDYIVFLDASTRYASDDMLEWMVLASKVEHADVCACRVRRDGQVAADDIAGMVFDLAWLRSSGIEFVSEVDFNDWMARRVAMDIAKRVIAYPKVAAIRSSSDFLTQSEKAMDALRSIAVAAQSKMVGAEVLQKIAVNVIRLNQTALRGLVWGGSLQSTECSARELLRSAWTNLGLSADECELLSPLVSVIVPAYNVEKYLPRCLDSLAAQTLASLEIIVVDDGSTDSTLEIAKSYSEGNARFKVVHRENGGLSAARNSGLAVATGKYVGFVDGDDYVDRVMFETMSNMLEKDPAAEIAVCGAKVEFSYPVDAKTEAYAQKYFELPREGGADLDARLVHDITSSVCTKLYRRSFLCENGISFPEGMENEDEVFFFFTMGKAHRVELVKRPFYHYIRNESGIMARQASAFDSEGVLPDSLRKAFPLVLEYLKGDDRRDLLGVFFRHVCGVASRYTSPAARSSISWLLHNAGFFYYREFLDSKDLGWVDNQLKMCHNYDCSTVLPPAVDRDLLPRLRNRIGAVENPAMTFIVPVFNQERYLSFCLESIRRQTERNIEIICVNDGSTDHSDWILNTYSEIDGRIVVLRQENKGVSSARNLALESARGKYVAFVDGDDYVSPSMAADLVRKMDSDRLDVCPIDFDCFDYSTRKSVPHYWELRNHRSKHPSKRVFSFGDIPDEVCFFGGAAGSVWSREYLNRQGLRFPSLVNNEDLLFSLNGWVRAGRMGIAMVPYYHYRRGNPSSAVSNRASGAGDLTVIDSFHEMSRLWQMVQDSYDAHVIDIVAKRLLVEVVYHGTSRPKLLAFLQEKGFEMFGFDRYRPDGCLPEIWQRYEQLRSQAAICDKIESGYDVAIRNMPISARQIVKRIESRRQSSVKDLYIITGQLNSSENDPIDSWTFFKWLQSHGVPSRYVMWKKHKMYPKLEAEGDLKDVILLDGDGCQDYEFVEKCEDELVRCKMVAQENGALNRWLRVWLYYLPGCQYTYLEHGIKFLKHSAEIGRYLATYNVINNTSVLEKELLESNLPGHYDTGVRPTCIVGGLPRLDYVRDERSHNGGDYTVFIMLTWRATFNDGQDVLEKSAYSHGLRALLCEENIKRLERVGVKIVLTAHHHLVNHIKNLDFGTSVEIVPQEDVAYWKSHADCCVTDYSSISFDFLFLGRPVVYWTPDREDLLLNHNDYAEIVEAESRKKHIFNVVDSPADVIDMIENYAKNGFALEPEKAKIVEKFFAYRTDFCQHLYDALEAVSGLEKPFSPAVE